MAAQAHSDGPRLFTVEQANALVPTLQLEFGRLAHLRGEVSAVVEALGGPDEAMAYLEERNPAKQGLEAKVEQFRRLVSEINGVVQRVNDLGCLVKDLEMGLVDFLSMRGEEAVFLCWQFGEPAVAHWHPVDEGFAGRQPLEDVVAQRPEFLN
ncbi:MAG TPA: DUF2203 domain-containing protein [Anaeromyxobacteraceae bacterium]|nr:DUF2203 domain-containing protein [Anaeromyxobacteraceae bacterium]